jgi:hypothetical protein
LFPGEPESHAKGGLMNEQAGKSQKPGLLAGILMRFGTIAVTFLIQALILFLAAGTTDWIWAWIFLAIGVVCVCINATILLRTNPETAAERGRPKQMQNWDKVISVGWGLLLYLILPLLAGLDRRFGWTAQYGAGWNIAGAAAYAAGLALFSWAMISNAFFSTATAAKRCAKRDRTAFSATRDTPEPSCNPPPLRSSWVPFGPFCPASQRGGSWSPGRCSRIGCYRKNSPATKNTLGGSGFACYPAFGDTEGLDRPPDRIR